MRNPGRIRGRQPFRASLERLEQRQLLAASIPVTTTADSGPGSLRDAIIRANARSGPDNIVFDLDASTAPGLDVPVAGFDPRTQTWRISLDSPLPPIVDQVTIDGLTQANASVPYFYPAQTSLEPTLIVSSSSTVAAKAGNNAALRVIVDGSRAGGTGFDIQAPHTILRGLIIGGFDLGVDVAVPDGVGVLVQGNSIGGYLTYPVNPLTGVPLTGASAVGYASLSNQGPGVRLAPFTSNATVGGMSTQEANVIVDNRDQGVLVVGGAVGNLIAGNQIGIAGPSINGLFVVAGNGAEGVRIESTDARISGVETSSSTTVVGNLISGNALDGIHALVPGGGSASTRINILSNYVGAGPGGGFRFGSPDTGNHRNGIWIEGVADNRIGGTTNEERNVISANEGAGVRISGAGASRNIVLGNVIGVIAGGGAALGNSQDGVLIETASNTVGPGNVISANLRGVRLAGPGATGNLVQGNKIGTNSVGSFDLGNAQEGIRIDGAPGNLILGDAAGSQVISGNNVGILIIGMMASGNRVLGNFIGTNVVGDSDLGNSLEGVRIEEAPGNTIGGSTASDRNVISSNHWGVTLTGRGASGNLVQGNAIGTDLSGTLTLGNEIDGVLATNFASDNLIGGPSIAEGNTIAFNRRDGVRVEDFSVRNEILTNRIFLNGGLGIDLTPPEGGNSNDPGDGDAGPNGLQNSPDLTDVNPGNGSTTIQGTLNSTPNTTFRIQFFAVIPPGSRRLGEGGDYLGEVLARTDAAGNASFTAVVPVAVPPGQGVVATATDSDGNTSEFSGVVAELPTTIEFEMPEYTVSELVNTATIYVRRLGGTSSTVTVSYSTADGTARAGIDYLAKSGTITFGPGETRKPIEITILNNPEVEGVETVIVNLFNPTGGAALGPVSSTTLAILDDTSDRTGPTVTSARAVAGRLGVASVIITFDEPLDPTRAVDLVNYGYSLRYAGRDGRLGTRDDLLLGIASASLDPSGRVVTLILARAIHKKAALRLMINQATDVEGARVGVSDRAGNLLDGDADGRPGGPYVARVVTRAVPKPRRGGKARRPAR